MITSIGRITADIQKLLIRIWTLMLRMGANQNTALSTKLYRRIFLRTRTNKNAVLSTKLYQRIVPRTITNYVLRRETNQNEPIRKKKTQRMRLHAMWRTILTSLTYLNVEETILTFHVKELKWMLKTMNTFWAFLTLWTNIKNAQNVFIVFSIHLSSFTT